MEYLGITQFQIPDIFYIPNYYIYHTLEVKHRNCKY